MGQLVELVGDQNPGPEAPPRSTRGRKGDVRKGAMEDWRVRVIESREMTQSDTFHGCQKYLLSPKGVDGN